MKNHSKSIVGLKCNFLTAKYPITDNPKSMRRQEWMCDCECGKTIIKRSWDLRKKRAKSCGCQRVLNLVGKKFNKLTVISRTNNDEKNGDIRWICRCDCGKEKIVSSSHLANGNVGSCGCIIYKGYGEIYGTYFNRIKNSAKQRELNFELKIEDIWHLFLKQNRKCALSGLKIEFSSKCDSNDGTASLDRIDSSKGYTIDNVQWVHKDINYMKQDNSDADFIKYCCLIADHSRQIK
jgi:hypothetical protein